MNGPAATMLENLGPPVVLLAACGGLSGLAYLIYPNLHRGWRFAAITAYVFAGFLTLLATELLSAVRAITFAGFAALWGIAGLLIAWGVAKQSRAAGKASISFVFQQMGRTLTSLPRGLTVAMGTVFIALLILGFTTLAAAPNTWDSMTYHLPRVMHWQQDKSLDFYPTAIERQLFLGPFAEIAILNLDILAGDDRLAGLVQYLAMIGSLVGVSLIAKLLGGNQYAQVFAVLATVTIPMGILQSTGTQNDYVLGLWLVCFSALVVLQVRQTTSWRFSVLAGVSLGLAILTKATAIVFAAPMGLWLAFILLRRSHAKALVPLAILICSALVILVPHSLRNYGLYGNPLGPPDYANHTNELHSGAVLVSNMLRNLGMELALPSDPLNRVMTEGITALHGFIRLDLNDPRTTFPKQDFWIVFSRHEARAANPFHTILIIVSLVAMICRANRNLIAYFACIASGFLLFCFVLRWQPWQSRLLLPLYVLAMPASALVLSKALSHNSQYIVMAMLTSVAAIAYLFQNPSRPLVGPESVLLKDRWSQYFSDQPELLAPYNITAEVLANSHCSQIGLVSGEDGWEYPVWVMTSALQKNGRIEHILVKTPSSKYALDFTPCAILDFGSSSRKELVYGGSLYSESISSPSLSLFLISTRTP